jgi:hypothetical protein
MDLAFGKDVQMQIIDWIGEVAGTFARTLSGAAAMPRPSSLISVAAISR